MCETKTLVLKMSKRSIGGFGLPLGGFVGMLMLLYVALFLHSVEALGQNNELQVRYDLHLLKFV